jgi:hypothetical protein
VEAASVEAAQELAERIAAAVRFASPAG